MKYTIDFTELVTFTNFDIVRISFYRHGPNSPAVQVCCAVSRESAFSTGEGKNLPCSQLCELYIDTNHILFTSVMGWLCNDTGLTALVIILGPGTDTTQCIYFYTIFVCSCQGNIC